MKTNHGCSITLGLIRYGLFMCRNLSTHLFLKFGCINFNTSLTLSNLLSTSLWRINTIIFAKFGGGGRGAVSFKLFSAIRVSVWSKNGEEVAGGAGPPGPSHGSATGHCNTFRHNLESSSTAYAGKSLKSLSRNLDKCTYPLNFRQQH